MRSKLAAGVIPISRKIATEVSSDRVEAQPSVYIPATTPPTPPGRWRARLVIALVGIGIVALAIWAISAWRSGTTKTPAGEPLRTATVERRDFLRTLRLHGTVAAVQSYNVSAPLLVVEEFSALLITKLAPAGKMVHRGDLLVEFDRQKQSKTFMDKQAEYQDLDEQINKKLAEEIAARARDESELKQAENAVEVARLEIRKNEVVSRIDVEKNRENLEEAEARLKQLRETFDLKRHAAAAEVRVLEIQRDRARSVMLHAQQNGELMVIHAPMDGLVVLNTIWKEGRMGQAQEGDQVRAGQSFFQLVNPLAMEVRARINQADIPYLRVGQPAQVRLDAYPDLVFPGKLEQVAVMGIQGGFADKVRAFPAIFSIQGSDPRLLPDLSAAIDVELEHRPNCLVVPRDAVMTEAGQSYVWAKQGSSFARRSVKTGPMNEVEVVIEAGLEAGTVARRGSETLASAL